MDLLEPTTEPVRTDAPASRRLRRVLVPMAGALLVALIGLAYRVAPLLSPPGDTPEERRCNSLWATGADCLQTSDQIAQKAPPAPPAPSGSCRYNVPDFRKPDPYAAMKKDETQRKLYSEVMTRASSYRSRALVLLKSECAKGETTSCLELRRACADSSDSACTSADH